MSDAPAAGDGPLPPSSVEVIGHASSVEPSGVDRSYASAAWQDLKNLTKADFSQRSYWEERFKEEEEYDWLCDFEALHPGLRKLLDGSGAGSGARILVIGCGNSNFSADLYDAGYHQVTNIDFAASVIARMADKNRGERPEMRWLEMDMLHMTFEDGFFDMVIGKGSLDALHASIADVWHPNAKLREQTDHFLRGVRRVLRPGGRFVSVSFEQPHFRTKYLMDKTAAFDTDPYSTFDGYCSSYGWQLAFHDVGAAGALSVFMYVMTVPEHPPPLLPESGGGGGGGGGGDGGGIGRTRGEGEDRNDDDNNGDDGTASGDDWRPAVVLDIPGEEADRIHNGFPDNSDSSW
jgi:SAM-dependent methyltransferase